jgi:hypothetical protein
MRTHSARKARDRALVAATFGGTNHTDLLGQEQWSCGCASGAM